MTAAAEPRNQVETIRALGFSERDARFLAAVVCAGGFFLRRQYAEALGIRRGRTDAEFVSYLVARNLATVQRFCDVTQVLHLTSRSFYEEEPDVSTRARRSRSALQIKPRLMALDAILARPDVHFASGQIERLRLCEELRIPLEAVPARHYRPHQTAASVTRYLTDAHLVGVTTADDGSATLLCGYVDEGAETRDGFHTFLRRHQGMFGAARAWTALYVCQSARQAASARRVFERVFLADALARATQQREQLLEYMQLRTLYMAQRWGDLQAVGINRYLALKRDLGPAANLLFEQWEVLGDEVIDTWPAVCQATVEGRFQPLVLTHSYAAVEPRRGSL